MACILLFGKPETIQSCVPGYKTDAIYRVENLDRYDDRLIVENNLMESYDLLIDFIPASNESSGHACMHI